MAVERERKFLVNCKKLPTLPTGNVLYAGYFTKPGESGRVAIRVTKRVGGVCKVCFKGPGTEVREEFEYTIPTEDGERMLDMAPTHLTKTRYELDGWEIDHYTNVPPVFICAGRVGELWVAEWDESHTGMTVPPIPEWIVREITEEPDTYGNQALAWNFTARKENY